MGSYTNNRELKRANSVLPTKTGRKRTEQTEKIIDLLKSGKPGTKIAKLLDVSPATVYSVKKNYKDEIVASKELIEQINTNNYSDDLDYNLKASIIKLSNNILNKDLKQASLSQLATTLGILFDKHRLLTGKSTQNIATQILTNIDENQLKIIQESIQSLKESMLKG